MPRKITPFLWFENRAEEAMNFNISVFKDSEVLEITRNVEGGPGPEGSVLVVSFRLESQEFMALNGGPHVSWTRLSRSWSIAPTRRRSITSGRSSPRVASRDHAAG